MTLEIDRVSIMLAGKLLVPPLSATLQAGDVLVVMGPSGSGKSSLLAGLAGLLEAPFAMRGRVRLDGQDITERPLEQRRVGLLFQDDLLFPHMTLADNLLFALPPKHAARAERIARAHAALAEAELAGMERRLPSQLSGGQRARVSLMRALLAGPRALPLDEPFSRLDQELRGRMREFTWNALRERRVCGVLVTHDAADAPPGARIVQLAPCDA